MIETILDNNPNLIRNLDINAYHARPELSNSGCSLLLTSPAHYKCGFNVTTKAMKFGTLFHTALLEPGKLSEIYEVGPEVRKNSKEWKDFETAYPDKICLKPSEMNKAIGSDGAIAAIHDNTVTNNLFSGGVAELSVFGSINNVQARCRPDYLVCVDGKIYCIDLKKISSADKRTVKRSIERYLYYMQGAWYTDVLASAGIAIEAFIFVFLEENPPHNIRSVRLSMAPCERGRELYMRALDLYKTCIASDRWPGYPESIEDMELNEYSYYNED